MPLLCRLTPRNVEVLGKRITRGDPPFWATACRRLSTCLGSTVACKQVSSAAASASTPSSAARPRFLMTEELELLPPCPPRPGSSDDARATLFLFLTMTRSRRANTVQKRTLSGKNATSEKTCQHPHLCSHFSRNQSKYEQYGAKSRHDVSTPFR